MNRSVTRPCLSSQGEMWSVKPIVGRQKGAVMIKQPERGSRNVNDTYYDFEARMIEKMNAVLGDVELTKGEERTLLWLAGWEECTVDHLMSVIEKVARKRAEEGGGYAHDKRRFNDSCRGGSRHL